MNLFETIKLVQPGLPGWCVPEKAETLAALVLATRPKVSVEVGIFGGSSFFPIALAHREIGTGVAYGIDPWSKAASIQGEVPANVEYWGKLDYESVYSDFMRLLSTYSLTSCTRIIRQKSDDVEPPKDIDLLHLDGNHTQQAVRDVERFAPKVTLGGFCVMDDEGWEGGGVERGCELLVKMGFKRLYPLGSGSVFQRL